MTFACYDIPFVQETICTITSIHPLQLVFPLPGNNFPAQVTASSCPSPSAPRVSSLIKGTSAGEPSVLAVQ